MLSTSDRLLIRWAAGHVEAGAPGTEQYLELRGVKTADDARGIADELLAAFQVQRGTDAVSGHVHTDSQQPMSGFRLGDFLDGQRVQSVTLTADAESNTVATPELADPAALLLEQLDRKIQRLNAGTTSEYASPFPPPGERGDRIDSTPPEFKYSWGDTAPTSTPSDPVAVQLGALGYWPLRSNLTDQSGNGNDLSVATGTEDYADGWFNADGSTTLTSGLSVSAASWTIVAYAPIRAHLSTYSGAPIIAMAGATSDADIGLFLSEGHPYIHPRHYISGDGVWAETVIDEAREHKLALAHDAAASETRLYVDGVLAAVGSSSSSFSGGLVIGGTATHGRLGEVSIYDYALTQAQIASL